MKSKTKYFLIKTSLWVLIIPYFYGLSKLLALIGLADLWGNMFDEGLIDNFWQWITLIMYRFFCYIFPALLVMFIKFDKRMTKKSTRYIIWQNQVFCIYLFSYAIIQVLALNMIEWFPMRNAFGSLTFVVSFAGYILTLLRKEKIEFDSNGAIIDVKPYKN